MFCWFCALRASGPRRAYVTTRYLYITAIDNKADAAFYALLTADQKTELDQLGADGFGGHGLGGIRVPGAGH